MQSGQAATAADCRIELYQGAASARADRAARPQVLAALRANTGGRHARTYRPRSVQQRSTATTALSNKFGFLQMRPASLNNGTNCCWAEFATLQPSDQVNVYE